MRSLYTIIYTNGKALVSVAFSQERLSTRKLPTKSASMTSRWIYMYGAVPLPVLHHHW